MEGHQSLGAQSQQGHDRRRRARAEVHGEVLTRVSTTAAVVLNISEAGALLAVQTGLRPGVLYVMRLQIAPDLQVSLRSRVVWSTVHEFCPTEVGEAIVTYHAAVEFMDLSEGARQALKDRVEQIEGVLEEEFG